MPITIASAVINTGLSLVLPASITASIGERFFCTRTSLAKLTTRIELDTEIPTDMIAPMSDSTFTVVPVNASIHAIPASAPGTAAMMMIGSTQDWKRMTNRA
jgi:hypothetical protein